MEVTVRQWPEVGRRRLAGCAAALSLVTVAACAPVAATSASQNTGGSSSGRQTATESPTASPDCTKATKVAIVETSAGVYAFNPSKLTVQRGGFLAVTNKSAAVHTLATSPDAGIVTSVLDKQERQVIQFPEAGKFTVESADAAHRAVLRLTVSGDSGCGAPKPTLTISGAAAGHYIFTPKALTVVATANFAVVNKSNVAQTVLCDPDPGGNGDNSKVDQGETQLLAIDKPGRYACYSLQHSNAKVTITVTGN